MKLSKTLGEIAIMVVSYGRQINNNSIFARDGKEVNRENTQELYCE